MDECLILSSLNDPDRFRIMVLDEIDSTNAHLVQLAKRNAPEWTVAVSEEQTAGRGRLGRSWSSPKGFGLWFSILLRPDLKPDYCHHVNLISAVCLSNFLEKAIRAKTGRHISVDLKWPNDVLIQDKKLCGILLQSNIISEKVNFLVLGIGLNVNQVGDDFSGDLREKATSLKIAAGQSWIREILLAEYLENFYEDYHYYLANSGQRILDSYLKKVSGKGELISVKLNGDTVSGIFKGLSPQGYLILQKGREESIITTGEII